MNTSQPTTTRGRAATWVYRLRARAALPTLVILLAAACSSGTVDSASTATPGSAADQDEVTSTPAAVATSADITPKTPAEPLQLVGIGDSFIGWSTVAEQYADLLAQDFGVVVTVDKITNPTSNRLDYLRTTNSAQALLADAEIVILQPQPGPPSAPA